MIIQKNLLAALTSVCVLLSASSSSLTQPREQLREEFQHEYPLTANGIIDLENITGSVHVRAWDQNTVKIDAIKRAYSRQRITEVEIKIDASPNAIHIKTQYPYSTTTWTDDESLRQNNPASVEYTLTVPRGARLGRIELINGSLDVEGLTGQVNLSCVNGTLTAHHLKGVAKLSTVNGKLDVTFNNLARLQTVSLNSVNGNIDLTLPSGVSARIKASTAHGGITSDFGFAVRRGSHTGSDLTGVLGGGDTPITMGNVNGSINIRRTL
jgi:hypothetical protein